MAGKGTKTWELQAPAAASGKEKEDPADKKAALGYQSLEPGYQRLVAGGSNTSASAQEPTVALL